jgi:hypothetical protein
MALTDVAEAVAGAVGAPMSARARVTLQRRYFAGAVHSKLAASSMLPEPLYLATFG